MLKDGERFGDICEEKIPKGTVYRRSCIEPGLTPIGTTNPGRHAFYQHACTTCVLSMSNAPERMHQLSLAASGGYGVSAEIVRRFFAARRPP